MTSSSLEARVAHVEGIVDELRARLASIENRLDRLEDWVTAFENRFRERTSGLETRMQTFFLGIVGILTSMWVTVILAILLRT